MGRVTRRSVVIGGIVGLLAIAGVAAATHRFSDVVDGSTHAPGIEWVADAGVTSGCGDGTAYCPDDAVTRAQMGTFMHRLSGNAPGIDPSVDAATVEGYSGADLMTGAAVASGNGPVMPTDTLASMQSIDVTAPADGFLFVVAHAQVDWPTAAEDTRLEFGLSLDGATLPAEQDVLTGGAATSETVSMAAAATNVFAVSAGDHTVHLMGQREGGVDGDVVVFDMTISVFFTANSIATP